MCVFMSWKRERERARESERENGTRMNNNVYIGDYIIVALSCMLFSSDLAIG